MVLSYFIVSSSSSAQSVRIFDVDTELSSSLINYLFQDSNGLMWVATEEGLNCYDGNKFRQYRNVTSDPSSLCSNYVNSVFETHCGKLFVCTNRGIQIFNPVTRSFSSRIKDYNDSDFMASVMQTINRGNGDYWIIGDSLRILKRPKDHLIESLKLSKAPNSVANLKNVRCGAADNNGNIWLSLSERGLICVTPENKTKLFFGKPNDPAISCMVLGKDGLLYLGSMSHGLLRYNPDTNTFEYLSPSTGKEIKNLYVEKTGEILQATDGTGILVYNPYTGATSQMHFGNRLINSRYAKSHYVMRDNCNNLWVGVFQTGVLMIPDNYNSFEYLGPKSEMHDVIGNHCVSAIFKDSEGVLWVGADNDGIYALNPDYTRRAHFYNDDISVPMCIYEDSRKNLWVGTYMSGVGRIDRTTGQFHKLNIPWQADIPAKICFAITEDRDHNIWFGMLHSGLIRYNLDRDEVSVDFPWRQQVDPFIASLYYSSTSNNLYIGTYSGLQIVNRLSHNSAEVQRLLPGYIVHSIDENKDGIVWIGTTNGLVSYNPKSKELKYYGVNEGLPSSTIYAVRCKGKNVWMSLNNGISRLDTKTGNIATFLVGDGLQGNEFYKNSVFLDEGKHLYFGGTGGITHFNPDQINDPGKVWTPIIVDLYSHGHTIEEGELISTANKFNISHEENSFSVEFGTQELARPETVRFAYSIDGKPWEMLPPNTNTLNFYNLDPGKHSLSFRTIDGLTQSPEKTVSLAISYPWYNSPGAWIIYLIMIGLLLWSIFQGYIHRMKSKAQLLELKHSDQLNEARLMSYVNISHEIRTPMSLVISPLQKLLANDKDEVRQREYKLIMRNAKRVLRLIDELMDLRKIEKHQMQLTYKKVALVPFIEDICDTFAQAVADKNQNLEFIYSDADIKADIDATNLDKILMNLFSNAVKFTPQGGEIKIYLDSDQENAIIKVIDTGVGISNEDKIKIFDRFFQVKGHFSSGSGVGLHLTQQLVRLQGGEISVSDNPHGPGTCFAFTIPLYQPTAEEDQPEMPIVAQHERVPNHKSVLEDMKIPDLESNDSKKSTPVQGRILVVEDDEEIKQYIASELASQYKVETCSNGKEALDMIFKNPPDLILSDIMMPEMDGLELTRTVKQNINLNHIPVVLLTALSHDEDNISAITAGADSYFTKPFNIEVVKERIGALLQRYRELKNRYSGKQEFASLIEDINVESADEKLIRKVVSVINNKINDPDLSVEKLAWEVGLSRVHLHRKLKEITNQSPSDFIRNTRLRQAAHLLREKKLSIAEVAYATGFNSTSTFSTSFKKLFGVTPSAFASPENVEA